MSSKRGEQIGVGKNEKKNERLRHKMPFAGNELPVVAAAGLGLPIPVIFWTQGNHPINGNSRIAAGRVRSSNSLSFIRLEQRNEHNDCILATVLLAHKKRSQTKLFR